LHRAMMCDYDQDGRNEAIVNLLLTNECYLPEVRQAMIEIYNNRCVIAASQNLDENSETFLTEPNPIRIEKATKKITEAFTRLKTFDAEHGTNFSDLGFSKNTANVRCLNNFDETPAAIADCQIIKRNCWHDCPGKVVSFKLMERPDLHKNKDFDMQVKQIRRVEFWERQNDMMRRQDGKKQSSLNRAKFKPPVYVPTKPNMAQTSKDVRMMVNTNEYGQFDPTAGIRFARFKSGLRKRKDAQ
jgi:hypothetical protein